MVYLGMEDSLVLAQSGMADLICQRNWSLADCSFQSLFILLFLYSGAGSSSVYQPPSFSVVLSQC